MAVVILDSDQIPEGISKKFVKFPGEKQDHYFKRITHLHHQNQRIYQIGDLSTVRNLSVLYLYNNRIEKLEHLKAVPNLEMLYLQNNKISKIENLSHLQRLKKLYLSKNRISVVEGLDSLQNLLELHIDNQSLANNQNLVFDPRSCMGLKNLKILNTSKNQILDLHPIELIPKLENLNVSYNLLNDLRTTIDIICSMKSLKNLDLRKNPLTSTLRYRETIIGICPNIEQMDGRVIDDISRTLMKNLHIAKERNSVGSSSMSTTSTLNSSNSLKSSIFNDISSHD